MTSRDPGLRPGGSGSERRGTLPPDQELAARIREGDAEALAHLFRRYYEAVRSRAFAFVGAESVAEEIASDVFTRLWKNRETWRPRSVSSFLMTRVRTLALNRVRSAQSRKRREERWAREIRSVAVSPDRSLSRRALATRLTSELFRLPQQQGRAFLLTQVHGFTYRKAAERMGISPRTVERHVTKARAQLRRRLDAAARDFLPAGVPGGGRWWGILAAECVHEIERGLEAAAGRGGPERVHAMEPSRGRNRCSDGARSVCWPQWASSGMHVQERCPNLSRTKRFRWNLSLARPAAGKTNFSSTERWRETPTVVSTRPVWRRTFSLLMATVW